MTLSTLPWCSTAVSVECCCSKLQPSLSVHSLGLCHRPVGSYSLLGLLSPCFPRPRSRVPQVSAKRARLSCPIRPRLLDHPSQRSQSWPVNAISIIAIRRMSDHRSSASGASPGHHGLPSLPTVYCTDHVLIDECEALSRFYRDLFANCHTSSSGTIVTTTSTPSIMNKPLNVISSLLDDARVDHRHDRRW